MKLCKLTSSRQRVMEGRVGWPVSSVFLSLFLKWLFVVLTVDIATSARLLQVPLQYRHIQHDADLLDDTFQVRDRRETGDSPTPTSGSPPSGNLKGRPGQGYYITVYIGTPPQEINVLVDTGSSNFAVAAYPDPFVTTYFHRENSSTLEELGMMVNVPYTQGKWEGPLVRDQVTLSILPDITVPAQVACITDSQGFFINASNWQGILGLAYAKIARPDSTVEPYFDSLIKSAQVESVFSMQLCGPVLNADSTGLAMAGTMVIGGVDESLYEGPLFTSPIHREWYYEVVITDVEVDAESLNMDCKEYNFDKTIVDSGTTNLRLPIKVYNQVVTRIKSKLKASGMSVFPSSEFWNGDDSMCWSKDESANSNFPSISLSLSHTYNSVFKLVLFPHHYLRPVDLSDIAQGEECFKFAISSSDSGTVLGAVVMEAFYTVFDRKNKTIGFGKSRCTTSKSFIQGFFHYKGNSTLCAYVKPVRDDTTLTIVAYVMAGVCVLCILPLVLLGIQWQMRKFSACRKQGRHSEDNDERPLHEESR
ncbi:beta-secretase 1-like [Liolophura sinensis]|uniref:beta-secretase 1-like n=1 Tax=Liolophura sinensis TaxID=3198878 RepID=UPI003158B539